MGVSQIEREKDPKFYVCNNLLFDNIRIQWRTPFYFVCLLVECLCVRERNKFA